MANPDLDQTNPASVMPGALDEMSQGEFVEAWKAIVGEPPSIMLDSRADMVRMLVESVPVAALDLTDASAEDQAQIEIPKP